MKMIWWLLMATVIVVGIVGCVSYRSAKERKREDVKRSYEEGRLVRYFYVRQGSTAFPEVKEEVTREGNECVIVRFRADEEHIKNGEMVEDSVRCGAEVMDEIGRMIVEAEAWEFERRYEPRFEVMDGWSWRFSAEYEDGRVIESSGSNDAPRTELFERANGLIWKLK